MSASLHSDTRGERRLARRTPSCHSRAAFTLIELVAVAVIIGILASMVLFAVGNARTAGQAADTKAKIARLDAIISRHWQSYDTRRVPLPSGAGAGARLNVLRQLMRMEMPDKWAEVTEDSDFFTAASGNLPTLNQAYRAYHSQFNPAPSEQFGNAECLYMIITVGLGGQGSDVSNFRESDVGDLDGDGAPEFHDAWGMPIRFLRWPIGFVTDPVHDDTASNDTRLGRLSDIMPPIISGTGGTCWPDAAEHHDPFDVLATEDFAFRVYPLIYSAGADKIYDIFSGGQLAADTPFVEYGDDDRTDIAEAPACTTYDVFGKETGGSWAAGANPRFAGRPKDLNSHLDGDSNNVLNHYDNIHNHRMSTE